MSEPVIARVQFHVGDGEWETSWDGSVLSVECGSLSLTIDWTESDWVPHAKRLVAALAEWDRRGAHGDEPR